MIPNGTTMDWHGHKLVFESEKDLCGGCFFADKAECPECDEGAWVEELSGRNTMASDKSFFIVCNLNKRSGEEWSTTLNKRTFVNAPNAQQAVDDVVADYKEQGYTSVECIRVFERIMNGNKYYWYPTGANT